MFKCILTYVKIKREKSQNKEETKGVRPVEGKKRRTERWIFRLYKTRRLQWKIQKKLIKREK